MAALTTDDFPEVAAFTVQCEVCGVDLPVPATVIATPPEQWAPGNYLTLEPDPTDVIVHYLSHV